MDMLYEKNTFLKKRNQIDIHFGLAYPNVYNAAMSSLGYNILYNQINEREDSWCERIIYPDVNSIESNTPLRHFDIISFTIQFEEDYFNILEMLKRSEVPLKRADRTQDDPLIIAGGPCPTANPMPLSDYIDVFIIGEGENVIEDFLNEFKRSNRNLENYLDIEGVFIPKYMNRTKISLIKDMDNAYHIDEPVISRSDEGIYEGVFNNTIMLNVSRGCTRGCRFCMAGYLYRPMRQTPCDSLVELAIRTRQKTGLNKITLIGAAVSDYGELERLTESLESEGFQISTPSLRIESITKETLKTLKRSGLRTITLAPESIEKLRKVINKDIPDETIFRVIEDAVNLDFKIKLYFLIGIPGETPEDIEELAGYMKRIAGMHTSPRNVKFSVNPIIPKPQTPLQWESYDFKDIKSKTRYLKREMKKYDIKCESPKNGLIQYILSCGDRDVGEIVERSLSKKPTLKEWRQALPDYDLDDELPWDIIDVGVTKRFLKIENNRLRNLKQTPWCEMSACYNCGSCEK